MTTSIVGPLNSGAASGSAGSATNNTDSTKPIHGMVLAIYIKYNDSPPAGTTDVTVSTKGTSPAPPTFNLIAVSNAATSGWFYPRVACVDTTNTSTGTYTPLFVADIVNVKIAQANAADNVDVWLLIDD